MNDIFDTYITRTIAREGGGKYVNDPADSGGGTMWGITTARARAAGYMRDMREMQYVMAVSIYRLYYWEQPAFDQIVPIDADLAAYMLDIGINMGVTWPVKFLQRSLNVMNNQGTLWEDIGVDGIAGAMTRYALTSFVRVRRADGMRVLMDLMASLTAVRYLEIAEANPSQERFEFGWIANRAFPVKRTTP